MRCNVLTLATTGAELNLAPEHYDPIKWRSRTSGLPLAELAQLVSDTISPSVFGSSPCLILDTSHATEGFINLARYSQESSSKNSLKKKMQSGDVIISRLRPYLRQVALVDSGIPRSDSQPVLCSTEFFVLRGKSEDADIAFLVPFLLCNEVQQILAASQSGGHHPRFDAKTLLELRVPHGLIAQRTHLSNEVRKAVTAYRASEKGIANAKKTCSEICAED